LPGQEGVKEGADERGEESRIIIIAIITGTVEVNMGEPEKEGRDPFSGG